MPFCWVNFNVTVLQISLKAILEGTYTLYLSFSVSSSCGLCLSICFVLLIWLTAKQLQSVPSGSGMDGKLALMSHSHPFWPGRHAPQSLLELERCNCKSGCGTKRCKCHRQGLDCSMLPSLFRVQRCVCKYVGTTSGWGHGVKITCRPTVKECFKLVLN